MSAPTSTTEPVSSSPWNKLQSSLAGLNFGQALPQNIGQNIGQSTTKLTKGFSVNVQSIKESLGRVAPGDITELPQEYKDLEARVDALREAHQKLLKIATVYNAETYDYPTQIQESITELGTSIGHSINNFAATNLKGTNLPAPAPSTPPAAQHKTLPHALGRAVTSAADSLQNAPAGGDEKLRKALQYYAGALDKVCLSREQHDNEIKPKFLTPWQTTLNTSIAVAMKARAAVRASRLELDAAKQTLKNAGPAAQEAARLEVENAEDDLVQKTEVAITLMKAVLENPEPLKNLNDLVKAQLVFHASAAEALAAAQGEVEELSVAAEGEYRKSRDH